MNETVTRISGIYIIRNLLDRKVYIGSAAVSLNKRRTHHLCTLRKGTHCNSHLQSAWNKYGEDAFEFTVVETCDKSRCIAREQYWIDYYDATNPALGYNICPVAGGPTGRPCSEETRAKIGAANSIANKGKGHPQSEETKAKISVGHLGKTLSSSHRRTLALRKLGRAWSLKRRIQCQKPS